MSDQLYIWTLYDHPTDMPDSYVARKFEVNSSGPRPTDDFIALESLHMLRIMMARRGLTCITRSPGDDSKIIESWI